MKLIIQQGRPWAKKPIKAIGSRPTRNHTNKGKLMHKTPKSELKIFIGFTPEVGFI